MTPRVLVACALAIAVAVLALTYVDDSGDEAPARNSPRQPKPLPAKTMLEPVESAAEREFCRQLVAANIEGVRALASADLVVRAVRDANAANSMTAAEIIDLDKRWRATRGTDDPLVRPYLTHPCADLLRERQREHRAWVEVFVMDDKGCIVAESDKTSDFWQGDEDKWRVPHAAGPGSIHVGPLEFDESSQSYVVQISVPVEFENAFIGAVTVSVRAARR